MRGVDFAIAANAGRDALRRRGARREESLGDAVETLGVRLHTADAAGSEPQMSRAVDEALRQLPSDQRQALLLHEVHGLTFPEVAAALGTSVGAAEVRAHRGYQRLRVLLASWQDT